MLRYIFKKSDQIYIRKTFEFNTLLLFYNLLLLLKNLKKNLIICILWLFQIYFLTANSPMEHMQYFLGPLGGCRLHFGTLHQIKWHQTNEKKIFVLHRHHRHDGKQIGNVLKKPQRTKKAP